MRWALRCGTWSRSLRGAAELANTVVELCELKSNPTFVYEDSDTLWEKMKKIATKVYGASDITAGAEFIVMICGDIMTMPALPKVPSSQRIDLTGDGKVIGLIWLFVMMRPAAPRHP